ncbi:IS3 family transposase [Serpentinicella sp. ANB-PHB4]|uniref:IS3 family transposase n=1 Tax=Serpentinicella sp. ANB-PHB4 TaxID=3074076 RepID=UPI002862574C|nr:IS3 family transposase [Serpentinicella sp. ANB-PHB4]MDR5658545.1 IS3 family transposase [Serpentinicella sp. ANB-PHB4]
MRDYKYQAILELQYKYPIGLLCEIAGISRTSLYKYKNKPAKRSDDIEKKILQIYNKSGRRLGYRSIKHKLAEDYSLMVNHKKVLRIMRELNIRSITRRKKKISKESIADIKANLLKRSFIAQSKGEKYVTDITFIPTKTGMTYLCVLMDLYDSKVVSATVSDKQDKELVIKTIQQVVGKINLKDAIIHSDQGVQYRSIKYMDLLSELGVRQSMSRKGNCWDNAKAESFFSLFKCEELYLHTRELSDVNEVKDLVNNYLNYYNNYRPQTRLGGLSPQKYTDMNAAS